MVAVVDEHAGVGPGLGDEVGGSEHELGGIELDGVAGRDLSGGSGCSAIAGACDGRSPGTVRAVGSARGGGHGEHEQRCEPYSSDVAVHDWSLSTRFSGIS